MQGADVSERATLSPKIFAGIIEVFTVSRTMNNEHQHQHQHQHQQQRLGADQISELSVAAFRQCVKLSEIGDQRP
ncbi:hypothetical protein [Agrobacterium tumefaciens]|uniref:hypothetical protein n=1 Tax=Agrobacterium tumefaciens TaxID=358 RepID=UPI00287C7EC2|nr:hypothetical protein [Agrobacterium tumefaciens]MDS7598425.1 hypothetical protein [Agrobacterium tumefaciens]